MKREHSRVKSMAVSLVALFLAAGFPTPATAQKAVFPNDSKKYSVGENAGMKLKAQGGIEIHVAAEKPDGVPPENWLPVNRGDYGIDPIMRIYAPDLERFKSWSPPKSERIE